MQVKQEQPASAAAAHERTEDRQTQDNVVSTSNATATGGSSNAARNRLKTNPAVVNCAEQQQQQSRRTANSSERGADQGASLSGSTSPMTIPPDLANSNQSNPAPVPSDHPAASSRPPKRKRADWSCEHHGATRTSNSNEVSLTNGVLDHAPGTSSLATPTFDTAPSSGESARCDKEGNACCGHWDLLSGCCQCACSQSWLCIMCFMMCLAASKCI